MIINVDLDGVVYPWHEMMAVLISELYDKDGDFEWDYKNFLPLPAPTGWKFAEKWGLTSAELNAAFRLGVERGVIWRRGRPIEGAVSSLWKLDQAGFYIRLVTTRLVHKNSHAVVQRATSEWLDEWNVPYHELIYQGKGTSKSDFRADFAIDDKPQNVREMGADGIDAYLLSRPWNQHSDLVKVESWYDFADIMTGELLDEYQLAAWEESGVEPVQSGSSDSQDKP